MLIYLNEQDQVLLDKLKKVNILFEASDYCSLELWKFFDRERKHAWNSSKSFLKTIAYYHDKPIAIQFDFLFIGNKSVCFWYCSSQYLNYDIIYNWFNQLPCKVEMKNLNEFLSYFGIVL